MCGILGSWQFDAQARGDAEDALARALPLIRHRGPDDIGTAAIPTAAGRLLFGHTRLAIIDLSAAGHQPMIRGTLSVVFNGEIYNYRELRQELRGLGHSFSTDTDTEVLLAAWQQWQQAALRRFTGMFAFALHDARDDSLTLARDAFGIKPLYYSLDGRRLLFGSEIAPLRALDPGLRRLDWQRACDYLSYGRYDCDERTFIQGISQIEPGCLIRYHIQDGVHPARWWTPRTAPTWRGSFADAAAEFRERFLDSVRLHLRSDVPVGAALSGGLDSASITCAMRHLEPDIPLHTFSYIAEGPQSEAKWAQLVNQHCAAQAHEVRVDTADLERDLDALIGAQGEPFGSTSIYAQYRVFQLAREHGIVVTLEGQGADELLAGYSGYPVERLSSMLESGHPLQALAYAGRQAHLGRHPLRLLAQSLASVSGKWGHEALRRRAARWPAWIRGQLLAEAGVQARPLLPAQRQGARGRRLMQAQARALAGDGLGALLRHGDRNAMRFSIESRVPFLTPDWADFLLSLPEPYLVSARGQTKTLLREGLRGIVPQAILERQDKIGFATPEQAWLRELAPQIRAWVNQAPETPFLDRRAVLACLDAMQSGAAPFSWQLWRWANYHRWLTTNEISPC